MDLFTQNMINRTKQRQELLSKNKTSDSGTNLHENKMHGLSHPASGETSLTAAITNLMEGKEANPSVKNLQLQEISQEKISGKENMGKTQDMSNISRKHKPLNTASFPIQGSAVIEKTPISSNQPNVSCKSDEKIQRPGALEPSEIIEGAPKARKDRMEALACRINHWEDEAFMASKHTTSTPEKSAKGIVSSAKQGGNHSLSLTSSKTSLENKVVASKTTNQKKDLRPSPKKSGNSSSSTQIRWPLEDSKPAITDLDKTVSPIKTVVLEKSVLRCLESQGFTPTMSRSRLIYEFEKEQEEDLVEEAAKSWTYATGTPSKTVSSVADSSPMMLGNFPIKPSRNSPIVKAADLTNHSTHAVVMKSPAHVVHGSSQNVGKTVHTSHSPTKSTNNRSTESPHSSPAVSVLRRVAQFDSPRSPAKDPAELTLSERKAMFENKKAQPTSQKASVRGVVNPLLHSPGTPQAKHSLSAHLNAHNAKADRMKELAELRKRHEQVAVCQQQELSLGPTQGRNIDGFLKKTQPSSTPHQTVPDSSPEKGSSAVITSPITDAYAGLDQIKPIRVSPPKPGKLYPCLSDIEMATDNEHDDHEEERSINHSVASDVGSEHLNASHDDLDSSFTVDILGRAGLSQFINTPKRKLQEIQLSKQALIRSIDRVAEQSSVAPVSQEEEPDSNADLSDLLNEALEDPDDLTPSKQQKKDDAQAKVRPTPLFHSISTYRKQQQDQHSTPTRQVIRNPEVRQVLSTETKSELRGPQEIPIQQQIRHLQEEINTQQNVMYQASQALNLCRSTAEFSGSTEQVEGERLLLVASQKKQAAMNEIQRLKTEAAMRKAIDKTASHGVLSISNLRLPLKKDFVAMLAKGGDEFVHYFVVLVRNRGQVIPLQMLSTIEGVQDGALCFPNLIQLSDLPTDFQIAIEVYALQTRKEKFDHEAKYHIRKESSKLRLTPKKLNKQDTRISKTSVANSVGSSSTAVRSSSFGLVGMVAITPASLRRKEFMLERVPLASPIQGTLHLRMKCHTESLVEERGFLTVFEDVAGFGAWHRRWCLLSNDHLLFWKYPDDEKRKEPLSQIDLRKCVTNVVEPVSHDVCARPNTFLLVTVRSPQAGDKDSLVMTKHSHHTALRHLVSADLKEERILWCKQINLALSNLRAWDIEALEPNT